MKKLFSIILLSLFSVAAMAQITVTGSVKDSATGDPLPGVGVIVSTGGGTITAEDGTFSLKTVKDATLTFNLLGYTDVVEPVNGRSK
ncbi:MAG: carboxypeptidase-like regulatory domain-containing protein, partial [Bacteroidales bacterium]|nr:carboxypeptidase-like regulatory domain-containing protein [Bacteroidales bacterium]